VSARPLDAFQAGAREAGKLCAICQTGIDRGAQVGRCPECESPFHTECWDENGGCATYGCKLMPETVKEQDPLQQQTHWGQEEKNCPRCNEVIKVAALRCKHCKAVFETSAPVSRAEYFARERQKPLLQEGRQAASVIFVLGLLPCTAPLCLLFGGLWVLGNKEVVRRLPGMHRVLCFVGLGAAGITSLTLLLAAVLVN
jgi:hypothetical protein